MQRIFLHLLYALCANREKSPLALLQAGICVRDERSEVDSTEVAVHQESVDGLELEFAGFLGAELQREEDGSAVFE